MKAALVAAVMLPVLLVVGVIIAAVHAGRTSPVEPLRLGPVPAPMAAGAECATLLHALPTRLGDYPKTEPAQPIPPATRAWRHDDGEPIILRCGVERPLEFNRAAPLQLIDTVQWFEIAGTPASTWYAVDRDVYVALTVPNDSGPTPLQEVSDTITRTLAVRPLAPGPLPN